MHFSKSPPPSGPVCSGARNGADTRLRPRCCAPSGSEDVRSRIDMQISVFGLGKVGLSFASCLTAAGHQVWGANVDATLVDALSRREFHTPEPGVVERLTRPSGGTFTATTDSALAVCHSDVTFVIVPTPSNTLGGFSLRYVLRACDEIGDVLPDK